MKDNKGYHVVTMAIPPFLLTLETATTFSEYVYIYIYIYIYIFPRLYSSLKSQSLLTDYWLLIRLFTDMVKDNSASLRATVVSVSSSPAVIGFLYHNNRYNSVATQISHTYMHTYVRTYVRGLCKK